MSHGKKEDNFDSIVNSLKPIKYTYSNQSLKLNKLFKNLNLKSLEKRLHQKGKPPAAFHDSLLYKKVEETYNLKGDSYDYFKDINGITKMPINIKNKEYDFVKKLYNPEFEKKIDDLLLVQKEEKKYNKEEFKLYKGIKSLNFGSDPGYYHPNYNFVKKRIPGFVFGKSSNNHSFNEENKKSEEKNNNDNPENKQYLTEKKENLNFKNNKINFDNYKAKPANMNNPILKLNLTQEKPKNKIQSRNINEYKKINITQKSVLPKIKINNNKSMEKISILKKIKPKTIMKKVFSTNNIISFKKMKGREEKNKSYEDTKDIFYNLNYDSTSPHVPSFPFQPSDIKKNNKKYTVGKIIRSYIFDPYKYYVMDFNENNNKKDKNRTVLEKNKKIRIKKYIPNIK